MTTVKKLVAKATPKADIKIDKGVKLPPVTRADGKIAKTLSAMRKGDSVLVPNSQLSSWYTAAKRAKKPITARRAGNAAKRIWIT